MSKMYFKNYSITCFGPNTGLSDLLKNISEGKPVIMDGGQLMISSFTSALNINEIEDILINKNYSFTIFEMHSDMSRAYTVNEVMQVRLFDNFFYKKTPLDDFDPLKSFSGSMQEEYIEYEEIDASDLHSEIYLFDLLGTLKEALEEEEYEYAGEVRDEIMDIDPEFYKKHVKDNDSLE